MRSFSMARQLAHRTLSKCTNANRSALPLLNFVREFVQLPRRGGWTRHRCVVRNFSLVSGYATVIANALGILYGALHYGRMPCLSAFQLASRVNFSGGLGFDSVGLLGRICQLGLRKYNRLRIFVHFGICYRGSADF